MCHSLHFFILMHVPSRGNEDFQANFRRFLFRLHQSGLLFRLISWHRLLFPANKFLLYEHSSVLQGALIGNVAFAPLLLSNKGGLGLPAIKEKKGASFLKRLYSMNLKAASCQNGPLVYLGQPSQQNSWAS